MAVTSESHSANSDGYAQVWSSETSNKTVFWMNLMFGAISNNIHWSMVGMATQYKAEHFEFAIPVQELHCGLQRTLDLARCEVRQTTDDSPWSE